MPIYEYQCNGCDERHEFIQKFSDPPKRKCPSCGKSRLRKLVSAAAFRLKGTGWYVTDFRDQKKPGNGSKGKDPDAQSSESSSASKSDKKATASSETKTATKGSSSKSDSSSAQA